MRDHCFYYVDQGSGGLLLGERATVEGEQPRLHPLTYDVALRLLNSTEMQARYQLPDLAPAALARLDLKELLVTTDRVLLG